MSDFLRRLQKSQPARYLFIGGVSYIIEMAALLSITYLLFFSAELAVACSFWIGLIVSFLLQKYIAFGSKNNHRTVVGRQAALYGLLVGFNYIFTITFVGIFVSLLGLVIARTLALITTTIWNYFVYKHIFKTT